jgi:iron complex outermembrane receptor protein
MRIHAPKSRLSKLRTPIHLAVLTLFAAGAQAQVQAQTQAQPPAPAASAASGPTTSLEAVTVTATKRASPLQRTPVAITSLSSSDLDKAHVQTIQDVVHLVPSFQATTQGDHGVITMTLRGIGNDSAKTEYADPEVALFVKQKT